MANDGRAAPGPTSRQRPHPRLQLGECKGFGHIVICAQVEPLDPLFDGIRGRQNQHRQSGFAGAQTAQYLEPGHHRQIQIENQQVEILGRERVVGGLSVVDAIRHVAGLAQRARQAIGQHTVIFGEQDTHAFFFIVMVRGLLAQTAGRCLSGILLQVYWLWMLPSTKHLRAYFDQVFVLITNRAEITLA